MKRYHPLSDDGSTTNLRILSGDGYARGEGSVDGEDDGFGGGGHDCQRHVEHRMISPDQHSDRINSVSHGVLRKISQNVFFDVIYVATLRIALSREH